MMQAPRSRFEPIILILMVGIFIFLIFKLLKFNPQFMSETPLMSSLVEDQERYLKFPDPTFLHTDGFLSSNSDQINNSSKIPSSNSNKLAKSQNTTDEAEILTQTLPENFHLENHHLQQINGQWAPYSKNSGNTNGSTSSGYTFNYNLFRNESRPFLIFSEKDPIPNYTPINKEKLLPWDSDGQHIFLIQEDSELKQSHLISTDFNGNVEWIFSAPHEQKLLHTPLISSNSLYIGTNQGILYRLDKTSGQIIWLKEFHQKIIHTPLIINHSLFFLTTEEQDSHIFKADAKTGDIVWEKRVYSFSHPNPISINTNLKLILITDPIGSLLALDLSSGNAFWQKKELGPLIASPLTKGRFAFVNNSDGLLYSLNLPLKKVEWTYDTKSKINSSPVYIPEYNSLAVLTSEGRLHVIDFLNGEGTWHFNTKNTQINQQVFVAPLNAKGIQSLKLKWKYSGWVLWSPCYNSFLCLFNPDNGQLLHRINLRGNMASTASFIHNELYMSLKSPERLPWSSKTTPLPKASFAKFKVPSPQTSKKSETN